MLVLTLSAAQRLAAERAQQQAALDSVTQALGRLRELDRQAAQWMPGPVPGASASQSLPQSLLGVLDFVRAADARHGVRVSLLALPGRTSSVPDGPADAQPLLALAHPVAGVPGLRSVPLDVRATYRNYAALRAWCAELEALPVIIRHATLEDTQLQLQLQVLGR